MNFSGYFRLYPLTITFFIVTLIALSLIFIVGIYKFALIILLSLILGFIGYLLDRSQIFNKS